MIVIQFSWLPLLWLNSTLQPVYISLYPLIYTLDYNHNFFITTID